MNSILHRCKNAGKWRPDRISRSLIQDMKALELIKENNYDCIIVDYMLPDIGGLEFVTEISAIKKMQMTPVLIYSAKDFLPKERTQLKQYANRILLKDVNSLDLLLEEMVMLLTY